MKKLYQWMLLVSIVNLLPAHICLGQEPADLSLGESLTMPESMAQVDHLLGLDDVLAFDHSRLFYKEEGNVNVFDLKLQDAVDLGIKNNLTTTLAKEKVNEALADKLEAMSVLLPQLDGTVSQQRTYRENLAAQGLGSFGGANIGSIGPFNTFDARLQLTQKIIDFNTLLNLKAGSSDVDTAEYENEFAQQKVVLLVSLNYLDALHAQADYRAAQANRALSKKLLKLAEDEFDAGLANSVDVARATTQLAQDELALTKTTRSVHDAYLELQRSIGLNYDGALKLMNSIEFTQERNLSLTDALSVAYQERLDMRIDQSRIKAGQFRLEAAQAQHLPKIDFLANYGLSGVEPEKNDRSTGSFMVRATIPIFEGGRIADEVKEVKSQDRQLELNFEDLKHQVEEDVREALWTMDTDLQAVNSAGKVVTLAQHELDLAVDSFKQGVGDNVQVLNAQASMAQARDEYVVALTQYQAARINLYYAMGKTNSFFLQNADQNKEQ